MKVRLLDIGYTSYSKWRYSVQKQKFGIYWVTVSSHDDKSWAIKSFEEFEGRQILCEKDV